MCKINKYTANICKNDNFWYDYLKKDYDPKLFLAGENLAHCKVRIVGRTDGWMDPSK
jgi:hypothetical protein